MTDRRQFVMKYLHRIPGKGCSMLRRIVLMAVRKMNDLHTITARAG
jgi:hypothetical protein